MLKTWLLDCATARELGLRPPATPSAASPRRPRRARPTCILSRAAQRPSELIADIDDGFYVTDLIGMGVNMVTGDYSRGASGFWIENGERTYPVSEVTIAGHLIDMFRTLTPANDLEFRYGTNAPTVRVEGLTVAGRLSFCAIRERLRSRRVREAGALALTNSFAAAQAAGPRARRLAGLRSRYRGRTFLLQNGCADDPATAGCRRKPRTIRRGLPRAASGSSIRSTARAPIFAGRADWSISVALVDDGRPVAGRALRAGRPTNCSCRAGRGATLQRRADPASAGGSLDGARVAGPKGCSNGSRQSRRHSSPMPRSIRWRCGLRASPQGALDAAIAGGNSHDWDLAAADLLVHEAGGVLTALTAGF